MTLCNWMADLSTHLDVWCERAWTTQFLHERNNEKKSYGVAQLDGIECNRPNKWSLCAHYLLSLHGLTSKHKNTILSENFPPFLALWIFRHTIFFAESSSHRTTLILSCITSSESIPIASQGFLIAAVWMWKYVT